MYRKRFGIETSYRQMHEARIKTCVRDPKLRPLYVGIALVLRNIWVWLHFKLAKGKWSEEPQLFLELLRFSEMLLWIGQVVGKLLHADEKQGIEYEEYWRLSFRGSPFQFLRIVFRPTSQPRYLAIGIPRSLRMRRWRLESSVTKTVGSLASP